VIKRIQVLLLFIGIYFCSCEDNVATNEYTDADKPTCGFGEL